MLWHSRRDEVSSRRMASRHDHEIVPKKPTAEGVIFILIFIIMMDRSFYIVAASSSLFGFVWCARASLNRLLAIQNARQAHTMYVRALEEAFEFANTEFQRDER